MPFRTEKQKLSSEHNWQLYKLASMRSHLTHMERYCSTLTKESRGILIDLIDQVDALTTSMKIRKY